MTSQILDLSLATLDLAAVQGKGHPSEVFEAYPADSPLEWDTSRKSGFQVEVLGAQTKVVVILWDKDLIPRLKF